MKVIVLGSAAGGGVPQWNCRCSICEMARHGDPRVLPRTQSSIAISSDGEQWLLVNASPDARQQLMASREMNPVGGQRHSPISAVLLTNGDVDHVAGLLTLREGQPFRLYATESVLQSVDANRIFTVCAPELVSRLPVAMEQEFEPITGLRVRLFAVPGKVALWLEDDTMKIGESTESTVGVEIAAAGKRLLYVPGCAAVTGEVRERVMGADALLFDGTMWTDAEMVDAGLGTKTARRMGHVPVSGADGSIAAMADLPLNRRIFVHINNTNPILIAGSPQRNAAERAGWEIGYDGMRITL